MSMSLVTLEGLDDCGCGGRCGHCRSKSRARDKRNSNRNDITINFGTQVGPQYAPRVDQREAIDRSDRSRSFVTTGGSGSGQPSQPGPTVERTRVVQPFVFPERVVEKQSIVAATPTTQTNPTPTVTDSGWHVYPGYPSPQHLPNPVPAWQ